jgi:ATP-binding cassette subfamily B protein
VEIRAIIDLVRERKMLAVPSVWCSGPTASGLDFNTRAAGPQSARGAAAVEPDVLDDRSAALERQRAVDEARGGATTGLRSPAVFFATGGAGVGRYNAALVSTLRFVFPFAKPYLGLYLAGLVFVPLSIVFVLLIPWITGESVDRLRELGAATSPPSRGLLDALGLLLFGILGLALARGATLFCGRWLIIGASRRVEFDLRNHLFRQLERLDQTYYQHAHTGDLMSRISQDVERVRVLAGPIILYSANTACMLLLAVPLMLSVSLPLTCLIMVPLSLLTVSVRVIGPRVHNEVFKAQETLSELSSLAQEAFSGIRVIKSFAQEESETARFRGVSSRYLEQNVRAARISAWMQPLVGAVNDLALVFLLLLGGYLMLDGRIQLGDFIKFAGYQYQLIWPMISIGWVANQFHRASASVARLRELLAVEPQIRDAPAVVLPSSGAIHGAVSIRGLTVAFGDRKVLDDVSLEVPRGRTVAVVGRTGAGKSTLVQAVPRMLPVPPGTVFVDGVDVNLLPLGVLRRAIGFVPQESFLFSRTVSENIAFGSDGAHREEIYGAAAAARFDKDIDQFPRGYDEVVGERGITLSGGQKQRAALARALLVRPRILILDDAFSSVDTQTEKEILRNLHQATEGMTVIVVAHRVSSILHADRIYVLDEGRVVEEGNHAELLARGGLYAETYRLQLLSDELAEM